MRRPAIALTAAVGAAALSGGPAFAAPGPPAPAIALFTENAHGQRVGGAFVGDRVHVVGLVRPYVPDQRITVRIDRNGRRVLRRVVGIAPLGNGAGRFMLDYRSRLPGSIRISATHPATPQLPRLDAHPRAIPIVPPHAEQGWRGYGVWALQRGLARFGYAVPVSGRFDAATGRAVVAFRKVTGMAPTDVASARVFWLLRHGHGAFHVRYRNHGRHFEADLTHQVLAEVDPGGRVRRIYELSSGKPSTPTVVGTFHIYDKQAGTNAKGMVDSNFFIRGYAIHGYADVPPYPASHGCLRIPIPDAAAVFAWARVGETVDVYYRHGGGSHHVLPNAGP
jgi:hypothetical protein